MKPTVDSAVAAFGAKARAKLANPGASGEPEEQLRTPFEQLLADLAELANFPKTAVAAVGESSVSDLKTRPDYAVTVHRALVGFIELKAPGKGADPRKFKDPHDRAQWEKLHSLPNLIYTDGNAFSLWQDGELVDSVLTLIGDIESSGNQLQAPPGLLGLFEKFFRWEPLPPRSAKELARTSARLCKLLRDEVTEQLALKSAALTSLAMDWRKLLFPEANDKTFADGYAQAVTFGLLMARAKDIRLATGFENVARELTHTSSLIGAALRLLTDNAENQATLKTSLGTLTRVLDAVHWPAISKGRPETWLYFYEDFLEVYDNSLRKLTGSYYTPPEVVGSMVRLVDEVLRSPRFGQSAGLAAPTVTVADPATGTGTYVLGILRKIAETVKADEGELDKTLNFQKSNSLGRIRSKTNGRCFFKTKTIPSDGRNSVEWQQGHRTEIGFNPSQFWNQRLAAASTSAGQTGFYFSKTKARHFRGRVFLAWLPATLADAAKQPGLLETKNCSECAERSKSKPLFEKSWVADCPNMGTFIDGPKHGGKAHQIAVDDSLPNVRECWQQL